MGGILGGGGEGGGGMLGGLLDPLGLFKGGEGGGGLLSKLPDPLGIGGMLGLTGQEGGGQPPGAPPGPPMPSGVQYNQQPSSGVSGVPGGMMNSPMSPTGMGVGSGRR